MKAEDKSSKEYAEGQAELKYFGNGPVVQANRQRFVETYMYAIEQTQAKEKDREIEALRKIENYAGNSIKEYKDKLIQKDADLKEMAEENLRLRVKHHKASNQETLEKGASEDIVLILKDYKTDQIPIQLAHDLVLSLSHEEELEQKDADLKEMAEALDPFLILENDDYCISQYNLGKMDWHPIDFADAVKALKKALSKQEGNQVHDSSIISNDRN